jgi:hypothetical protein
MKKLILGFSSLFLLFSCTENDTITDLSALDRGGFAVFADNVVQTADLSSGKYVADIEDSYDNIASYKIVSVSANIGGIALPAEQVSYAYTLPTKLELSLGTLAGVFGLSAVDVNYGDTFTITAEVTTKDGRVFGGVVPYTNGTIPSNANSQFTINNSTTDLLSAGNGYKSAMNFTFTVACPSYDVSQMYGTYTIDDTDWAEYLDRTPAGYTVQCVAGPRPNTLKFVNFSNVGTDLIVTINPAAQSAISDRVKIYSNFYTFGDSFAEGTSGLVFSCIGQIKLKVRYSVTAGTFANTWNFVLTKQ